MDSVGSQPLQPPRRKFLAGLGVAGAALFTGLPGTPAAAAPTDSASLAMSAPVIADLSALADTVRRFVPLSFFTNPAPGRQRIVSALTAHPQLTPQATETAATSLSASGEIRFAALSEADRVARLAKRTAEGARLYTANATTQATLITLHAQGIRYPDLAESTTAIFLGAVRVFVSRNA